METISTARGLSKRLLMRLCAALVLLGFICISLAVYSWASRYGFVEDYMGQIDADLYRQLSRISSVERLVGVIGGVLGLTGIIGLIYALARK